MNILVGELFRLLVDGGDIRSQAAPFREEVVSLLSGASVGSAAARAVSLADRLPRERRSRLRRVLLGLLEQVLHAQAARGIAPELLPFPLPDDVDPLPAGLNLEGDRDDAHLLALLCRRGGPAAAPLCLRALRDGNALLVLRALDSLPSLVPNEEAEAAFRRALGHASPRVRREAAARLVSLAGPDVPRLVDYLADPDESVRAAAANALAQLRHVARDALPHLIDALDDRKPTVRLAVVQALAALGPLARDAGAALCDLLARERSQARRAAMIPALEAVEVEPDRTVSTLLGLPYPTHAELRSAMLEALGALGPDAGAAARILWDMLLLGKHPQSQWLLAARVGELGPGAAEIVPNLLAVLEREAEPTFAAGVFSGLAPYLDLSPFLPHLDRLLNLEGLPTVPTRITAGLARAGSGAGRRPSSLGDLVPALCRLALRQQNHVIDDVRDALEACDPTGQRIVAELGGHLSRDQYSSAQCILLTISRYAGGSWREDLLRPSLRRTAWQARLPVWWKGPGLEEARRLLEEMLAHQMPGIRVRAADRLSKLGAAGRAHVPALEALLAREGLPHVRLHAARAGFRITGEPGPALAVVLEQLRTLQPNELALALEVLGELAPAPAAEPLLRPLFTHQYFGFTAAGLLARLDPDDRQVLALLEGGLSPEAAPAARSAAWALRWFPATTPRVADLLKRALARPSAVMAAESLSLLPAPPEELVAAVVPLLADPAPETWRPAALALLRLGRHTDAALAALSASNFDRPEPKRVGGVPFPLPTPLAFPHLLVELDERPGEAHRVLLEALRQGDGPARCLAAINLVRWGQPVPETIPALVEAVCADPPDGRALLRAQAARTLGEMGQAAVSVRPALEAALPALRSWVQRSEVHRAIARLRLLA
jgi:HEAT repeat protein